MKLVCHSFTCLSSVPYPCVTKRQKALLSLFLLLSVLFIFYPLYLSSLVSLSLSLSLSFACLFLFLFLSLGECNIRMDTDRCCSAKREPTAGIVVSRSVSDWLGLLLFVAGIVALIVISVQSSEAGGQPAKLLRAPDMLGRLLRYV